eukprot:TRINITY_DN11531_c1_g3_i1.p1 TRINITY_DN11531_c1_g3~~TRINITY_DN11531_c1_g3_i1.p1  ORF type:complete len:163 (+),score=29.87 TRINITY_DN11531_c1_g3_i1:250-738(+)
MISTRTFRTESYSERPQVWLKTVTSRRSFIIDVDSNSKVVSPPPSSRSKLNQSTVAPQKPSSPKAVTFNPAVTIRQVSAANLEAKTRDRTSSPFPLKAEAQKANQNIEPVAASKHPLALLLQMPVYSVKSLKLDQAPRMIRQSGFSARPGSTQQRSVLIAAI